MAAPTDREISQCIPQHRHSDANQRDITEESTTFDSRSKQELLDTIKTLQTQLATLQKAQDSISSSSSSSEQTQQSDQMSSTSLESQAKNSKGVGKRTNEGWQKIEGSDYLTLPEKDRRSNKKKRKIQKTFDFTKYNTRHVAFLIAYMGWDYHGFASQITTLNTIEGELFDALIKTRLIINRETCNYSRCGRTDKGVSAFGQVVSLDVRSNLLEGHGLIKRSDNKPNERIENKSVEIDYATFLNRVMPETIRVLAWSPVDVNFSARFDCLQRTYKYFFPKGDLDIEVMQKATKKLLGTHDFRNICKMDVANGVVNYTRTIKEVSISAMDETGGGEDGVRGNQMHIFEITGRAFLYHQVRCIMGLLLLIGQHKEEPEILDRLLDIGNQPCKPQYDMAVDYPLILYRSKYDGINWIYRKEELELTMRKFQDMWTRHSAKASIMKTMLADLKKAPIPTNTDDSTTQAEPTEVAPWDSTNTELLKQSAKLIIGSTTKVYRPILTRPVAESLENRIQHYAKKAKLSDEAMKT